MNFFPNYPVMPGMEPIPNPMINPNNIPIDNNFNYINNMLSKINEFENRIKKLEQKVSYLENHNKFDDYQEPDNSLYMI